MDQNLAALSRISILRQVTPLKNKREYWGEILVDTWRKRKSIKFERRKDASSERSEEGKKEGK